jgi:hypothetical protein
MMVYGGPRNESQEIYWDARGSIFHIKKMQSILFETTSCLTHTNCSATSSPYYQVAAHRMVVPRNAAAGHKTPCCAIIPRHCRRLVQDPPVVVLLQSILHVTQVAVHFRVAPCCILHVVLVGTMHLPRS